MNIFKIKKGLDLPIDGVSSLEIDDSNYQNIKEIALIGDDFKHMKPVFKVKVGEKVTKGQILFEDRKYPEIKYTALCDGIIKEIYRGEKRKFHSIVISIDKEEEEKLAIFSKISRNELKNLPIEEIKERLLNSGLWISLRMRPFDTVANPSLKPKAIFVNAMDSNPLAVCPSVIINENKEAFQDGLNVLTQLTNGKVNLCKSSQTKMNIPHGESGKVINYLFEGKHPSGLVGTHIHFIEPIINLEKSVFHIGYQDVIAIGKLFVNGEIFTDRYFALGGFQVKNPRIIKARLGAKLSDIIKKELKEGENRIISGSIFCGREAKNEFDYLGRYDNIVSVLKEDRRRIFHGFLAPGNRKFFSKKYVYF